MIKSQELTDPKSCMSRAREDEMTFVLLGRDAAAPVAIRAWIAERIRLGKNSPGDPQITEALECAERMEKGRGGADPLPLGVGDWVTRPDWDGTSLQIKEIREQFNNKMAFFAEGGFWRVSQLTRSDPPPQV